MTKPNDFSPSEALEVKTPDAPKESRRLRWALHVAGACLLVMGWLAVSLHDWGQRAFIFNTLVFIALGLYMYAAAAFSQKRAVGEEKRLRLRLMVHNMELEHLAIKDELANVFNRQYLFERLERDLETAKGFQRPLALIAVKIDSLGEINHRHGYATGDRLLAAFGEFLLESTRATDIPASMDGGKFAIILPDTSKRGAYTMLDRLISSLSTQSLAAKSGIDEAIQVSFGVSGYPWGGETADDIVRRAEEDLTSHDVLSQTGSSEGEADAAPLLQHSGEGA